MAQGPTREMTSVKPASLQPEKTSRDQAQPPGLVLIAPPQDLESLRAAAPELATARFHACEAGAALPAEVLAGASMVVVEVDPANEASLARLYALRCNQPGLPVIAALRQADAQAVRKVMRLGAADVAVLPFDPLELSQQLREVAASSAAAAPARPLAPMITVVGSTGGCGATTVITHLAEFLARPVPPRRVCVVDLDLQAGEVAYYVGQEPRVTVAALIDAGDRIDREFLRTATTDSQHGFAIIAAPETITALDEVEPEHLLKMLELVRSEYDLVLVDLPGDWTGWSLSVVLASTRVVMVTELSVASLRQARRRLQLLASVGLPAERVEIVANRIERRLFRSIGVREAAEVLGQPIAAEIAEAGEEMVEAQNEGHLITDIHRHSRFVSDIEALAQTLIQEGR